MPTPTWSVVFILASLLLLGVTNGEPASSQIWGPYRPNLYFGVRPQIPETFLMGLMWAGGENQDAMLKTLRDTCEQDDGMQGYGWTAYDTRVGGSQTMHDKELHVDLTTDFIKIRSGDAWAVRVTGVPRSDAPSNVKTTVIFHAAIEKASSDQAKSDRTGSDRPRAMVCDSQDGGAKSGKGVEATCRGEVPLLGPFEFFVMGGPQNKAVHSTAIRSVQVSEDRIWQAKSVFTDQVKAAAGSGDKPAAVGHEPGVGNMHFVQATFEGPFELTFSYHAHAAPFISSDILKTSLSSLRSTFATSVDKVFSRSAPFEHAKYANFSQSLLSNLLGGLGFFYGDGRVDNSHSPAYDETDLGFWETAATAMAHAPITNTAPVSLLSHTPSRPFFSRGFLWDEGFHLLPVAEWDLDLAVSVLRSWLNLMDEDGWIGREQILGPEARAEVPEEFQVQYPHYANPPTLLSLLVPVLMSKLTETSSYAGHPSAHVSSRDRAATTLRELYPLLVRHYQWFRRTQAGNFSSTYPRPDGAVTGEGYRWRGRTPKHTLTSGLDDYPRADPPHPAELHVDALAWVGASARALGQVAEYLGEGADVATYEKHLADAKHNLDVLHWDSATSAYCDATIRDGKYERVCHHGYLSLFPLFLGLLDADHPNLPAVLDLLSDPAKLWSPYGLRSLSAADANYGADEDYWRGAVWMNLNVLAVQRLHNLGLQGKGEPTAVQARTLSLAAELRKRVVDTVHGSWEETGFVWEQYGDKTGEGRHSRAFTGWTACVILLMGLDLAGYVTKGPGDTTSGTPATSSSPIWTIAGLIALVGVAISFKSFFLSRAALAVKWWQGWVRGQPRYEQVIDLDERQS